MTRLILACLLLAACEKAGGVEVTGGVSSHDETAPIGTRPKMIGTLPNDAGVVAIADAVTATATLDAARRDSIVMQEEEAKALASLLASEDSGGKDYGDMSNRRPGADLGRQIQDVRDGGRRVVVGSSAGGGRGGNPAIGGARVDTIGSAQPSRPTGRISVSNKAAVDDSSLTPDLVLAKIMSAYMAGIKRCYKTYLDKDASARGKMVLRLTVNATGRTINPSTIGFAKDIDDCITARMSEWRFPVPKDKDGDPTEATFSIGLNLVPD